MSTKVGIVKICSSVTVRAEIDRTVDVNRIVVVAVVVEKLVTRSIRRTVLIKVVVVVPVTVTVTVIGSDTVNLHCSMGPPPVPVSVEIMLVLGRQAFVGGPSSGMHGRETEIGTCFSGAGQATGTASLLQQGTETEIGTCLSVTATWDETKIFTNTSHAICKIIYAMCPEAMSTSKQQSKIDYHDNSKFMYLVWGSNT